MIDHLDVRIGNLLRCLLGGCERRRTYRLAYAMRYNRHRTVLLLGDVGRRRGKLRRIRTEQICLACFCFAVRWKAKRLGQLVYGLPWLRLLLLLVLVAVMDIVVAVCGVGIGASVVRLVVLLRVSSD